MSQNGANLAKVARPPRSLVIINRFFGNFTERTGRLNRFHVDIVGPLPYSHGFKYLFTCVDRFTRWLEAIGR